MDPFHIDLRHPLADDAAWSRLTEHGSITELEEAYAELTELLTSIHLQRTQRNATFAADVEDGVEDRAGFMSWKAASETVNVVAKARRDRIARALRLRVYGADATGLRLPIYRLASAVLDYENDVDADEEILFRALDECQIYARGKVMSLREFMSGGAKWD